MENKELCKKLLDLNENIVIVGPDYSKKNKLRVYNTGGRIARIYVGERNSKSELMTDGYIKYCEKDPKKLASIITNAKTEEQIRNAMLSKDYLDLSQDAVNKRHGNKTKKRDTDYEKLKERNVETQIMRKFMTAKGDWIAIDMEVQCPTKWFKKMRSDKEINNIMQKSKTITKQPRFDIITFSKEGIGIIELKVNNENCENMISHYVHMKHLLSMNNKDARDARDEFMKEMNRRIDYLIEEPTGNDLVNTKIIKQYRDQVFKENKLWCGFLFVGGGKSKSIQKVVRNFGDKNLEELDNLKFLYCDEDKIDSLNIENMQSYNDFTKESE